MMSQHLATTVPRGHSIRSRILIAIDDSEHSAKTLRYVGTLQREPMTGRAGMSLKTRFVSAHKFKGSERNRDVGTILTAQPCR